MSLGDNTLEITVKGCPLSEWYCSVQEGFLADTLIRGKKSKCRKANPKDSDHQRTHVARETQCTLCIREQKLRVRNFGTSYAKKKFLGQLQKK